MLGGTKMFAKFQKMLADQLNIAPEKITMESRLLEDLGADSLDFVELLMALEDEFNVTISDEEAKELKTVADVLAFIEKNQE